MRLTDRLSDKKPKRQADEYSRAATISGGSVKQWIRLKERLHDAVIDKLDLGVIGEGDEQEIRDKLRPGIEAIVNGDEEAGKLGRDEKDFLVDAVLDEVVGLGPLEALLADPEVSDILVNRFDNVYVERKGKLEKSEVRFNDNKHLLHIIQRMVSRIGRRVDESSPLVDARLPDGSRVNAAIPPISPDGPALSIRRFSGTAIDMRALLANGAASKDMMKYLVAAVRSKCNLLISGGTGAGKTTLLNVLSGFIPEGERVITIEDAAELNLQREHVVRMEARPPNIEGRGAVTIRDLVKNALRMRPDRIIIGEVRGAEILDMLQAMNTGHEGSMTTIHSNSPTDAASRLLMMLALSGASLSGEVSAQFIASSISVIVQVNRLPSGKRCLTGISEVTGYRGEEILMSPVFTYDPRSPSSPFRYAGKSTLLDKFENAGMRLELGGNET